MPQDFLVILYPRHFFNFVCFSLPFSSIIFFKTTVGTTLLSGKLVGDLCGLLYFYYSFLVWGEIDLVISL